MSDQINQIIINKEPSFYEIWYEGYVTNDVGHKYYFWLVYPQHLDKNDNPYEPEVRWFFSRVPREVRGLQSKIIEAFKQTLITEDDKGTL